MNKIKLNVLGISYSQTQSGAYALVLNEENGDRRIPIIVGGFEAQSIAIQLEGLNPPRPLTHDLFLSFANAFKIKLLEVVIHKLEEGVFYSKLVCDNGKETVTIDSRTSDAIALALRFSCPIFTTDDILQKAGVVLDFDKDSVKKKGTVVSEEKSSKKEKEQESEYSYIDLDELQRMLEESIGNENYEKATLIRDEMNRRKKKK